MSGRAHPLLEVQGELLSRLETLRDVADRIGETAWDQLGSDLIEIQDFVHRALIPHTEAEASVLYPAVQWALNSPVVMLTMLHDHEDIHRLCDELDEVLSRAKKTPPGTHELNDLRRILYSVHALVSTHFAKDEHIYQPLVKRCFSRRDIEELEDDMETIRMGAGSWGRSRASG